MKARELSADAKAGVGQARLELQQALAKGEAVTCPCCDRPVARTERKINRAMVEALRTMRDKGPVRTKDMPEIVQTSRDHPRLIYWGLAEEGENGYWRITQAGLDFLAGNSRVPRAVYVFDNEVLSRTETDLVSVHDCTDIPDGNAFKAARQVGGMSDRMIEI